MAMKKLLAASAVCGAVLLGAASPAFAGEITGNKKAENQFTPINILESDSVAEPKASECAFSGLEDLRRPRRGADPAWLLGVRRRLPTRRRPGVQLGEQREPSRVSAPHHRATIGRPAGPVRPGAAGSAAVGSSGMIVG